MNPQTKTDAIAAIATPPGEGAVAIVRLSGPGCHDVVRALLGPSAPPLPSPGRFRHADLFDPATGERLDDALVLVFRAPRSYTGEDAAELQVHGSPVVARRVLEAALRAGARQALSGEFTRRSFQNGRLDLTQAEAVMDLIRARSDRAARLAAAQLADALGVRLRAICDALLPLAADAEAMLDFPDDELPATVPLALASRLAAPLAAVDALLATRHEGRWLREGARVAIAGPPNAGKSTLLNALSRRDRAIVSPSPGTTRDLLEEHILLDGLPICLVDTAGLREAPGDIEREGVRRARRAAGEADFVLLVFDASRPPSPDEVALLGKFPNGQSLVILNKTDLGDCKPPPFAEGRRVVRISLKNDPSAAPVAEALLSALLPDRSGEADGEVAVSVRHQAALESARASMLEARRLLETGREEAFLPAGNALRDALESIGSLLGRDVGEEVLDTLFAGFCVGK
ncbi:MAG: tRNA uridine-5-carboxymethylaminomethyl(34) synthesis GTPase MnmE [Kiritimatiellae bacterium]|nr:tRNA uridine-5-carboxymethylaminomethyl(34) synthesis GTPase MnmE [Kiritimatiellia bacterium]